MFQNSTPWYLDDSVQAFSPQFSDDHGYFPYEELGVIAADTTTGEISWTYGIDLLSQPFSYDGSVACPGQQSVHIVDSETGQCVNQITYPSQFTAQPITSMQEDLFLAACDDGHLYAKRPDDTVQWKAELDHTATVLASLPQEVLIGYPVDSLGARHLQSGTKTWGYHLPEPVSAGPVQNSQWVAVGLGNGVVYLFSRGEKARINSWVLNSKVIDLDLLDEDIIAATQSGVARIKTSEEEIDWSLTLDAECHSIAVKNDIICVALHDGSIALVDRSSGEKVCRIQCDLSTDPPIIGADDDLFFGIRGHGYVVVDESVSDSGSITVDEWPLPREQLLGRLDTTGTVRPIGEDSDRNESHAGGRSAEQRTPAESTSDAEISAEEITDSLNASTSSRTDVGAEAPKAAPWDTKLDSSPFLPALVEDDVAVSTRRGVLKRFDGETSDAVWDVRIAGSFSTEPHVYDDQLVLLCEDSTLRTFDQETGDETLRLELPARQWDAVAISGSIACAVSPDGKVVGVDLDAGDVIWDRSFDQSPHLSPFTTDGQININIGNGLYRIDPEQGTTLLHCELGSQAAATAVHSGEIYYGTPDGIVHIIDLVSLDSAGQLTFGSPIQEIVSDDDRIYIITEEELDCLDSSTYEELWTEQEYVPTDNPVTVSDDLVIAADSNGRLIVRDQDGTAQREFAVGSDVQLSISTRRGHVLVQDGNQVVKLTDSGTVGSFIELLEQSPLGTNNDSGQPSANQTESDLEETITELQEVISTKDEQLSKFREALEAKDERIANLEDTLDKKEDRISTLSQYYNDVLENTVRPLLQSLIEIHAQQFSSARDQSDALQTFIEQTLQQHEVSIREPTPGDEYSPSHHDQVDTVRGAHPPNTIVEVRSPCYEWEFDDSILQSAEVVVSDGSRSLQNSGLVDGEVTEVSGAKCVYEGTVSDAPRTTARVTSLSVAGNEELIELFSTAVRRWEQLGTHPNTVNPIGWDTDPVPWVAHPLAEYQHLPDKLPSLGWDDRLSVIADVAESLRNADKYNTRHPSLDIHSVWLDTNNPDVTAAVADWGVQDLVRRAENQPWSRYAAPEQVSDDPIGSHTNIYRLGALSYHLLSGRPPFSDTNEEIESAIVNQEPSAPSSYADALSSRVDDIILQAMASDPADRFNSAYSFRVELLDSF